MKNKVGLLADQAGGIGSQGEIFAGGSVMMKESSRFFLFPAVLHEVLLWQNLIMFTWNLGPCAKRSQKMEWVDAPDVSDEDLSCYFDFHHFLGRRLGGYGAVAAFLEACSARWEPGQPISILDLRCGRGDLDRAIVQWGRRRKADIHVLAVDRYENVIQMAREHHGALKEIVFETRDLRDPLFLQAQQFDYVIASHIFHLEKDEHLLSLLKMVNRLAKRGIFVLDWLRDVRGWWWMKGLSRLWGCELVLHDAPLSIERGFLVKEWEALAKDAGLEYARSQKHLGYRLSLSGERGLVLARAYQPQRGLAGT